MKTYTFVTYMQARMFAIAHENTSAPYLAPDGWHWCVNINRDAAKDGFGSNRPEVVTIQTA